MSIFLGDELTAILRSIIDGTAYVDITKKKLEIGVDTLPELPQDTTDRNRTSPLAFTGNKFEFRMLGSSQSIASPNVVLNTIMADELKQFADRLEKAESFHQALQELLRIPSGITSALSSTVTATTTTGYRRPSAGG